MNKKIFVVLFVCGVQMGCATMSDEAESVPVKVQKQDKLKYPKVVKSQPKIQAEAIPKQSQVIVKEDKELMPAKPTPPAVLALLADAENSSKAGNLDAAVATIERALRIEPRNAKLLYELASLRLKQEKPRLAEDLARKSVLLSANDLDLKRRSWLLIAAARLKQGNAQGAEDARKKAAELVFE